MPITDAARCAGGNGHESSPICDEAGLTGRGRAAFATGIKVRATPRVRHATLIVNACDGEVGAAKDEVVVAHHLPALIEGPVWSRVANRCASPPSGMPDATGVAHAGRCGRARHTESCRLFRGERAHLPSPRAGWPAPLTKTVPFVRGQGRDGNDRPIPATVVLNAETVWRVAQIADRAGPGGSVAGHRRRAGPRLVAIGGAVARPRGAWRRQRDADPVPCWITSSARRMPSMSASAGSAESPRRRAELLWSSTDHALARSVGPGVVTVATRARSSWTSTTYSRMPPARSAGQCGPCMFGLPAIATDWHAWPLALRRRPLTAASNGASPSCRAAAPAGPGRDRPPRLLGPHRPRGPPCSAAASRCPTHPRNVMSPDPSVDVRVDRIRCSGHGICLLLRDDPSRRMGLSIQRAGRVDAGRQAGRRLLPGSRSAAVVIATSPTAGPFQACRMYQLSASCHRVRRRRAGRHQQATHDTARWTAATRFAAGAARALRARVICPVLHVSASTARHRWVVVARLERRAHEHHRTSTASGCDAQRDPQNRRTSGAAGLPPRRRAVVVVVLQRFRYAMPPAQGQLRPVPATQPGLPPPPRRQPARVLRGRLASLPSRRSTYAGVSATDMRVGAGGSASSRWGTSSRCRAPNSASTRLQPSVRPRAASLGCPLILAEHPAAVRLDRDRRHRAQHEARQHVDEPCTSKGYAGLFSLNRRPRSVGTVSCVDQARGWSIAPVMRYAARPSSASIRAVAGAASPRRSAGQSRERSPSGSAAVMSLS